MVLYYLSHPMITNLIRIVRDLPKWVAQRGPTYLMPQLPISWPAFALGIGIDRTWYLLDHWLVKHIISPLTLLMAILIEVVIILILVGLLRWQGVGYQAIGLSTDRRIINREVLVGLGFSALYIAAFMFNNTLWGAPPEVSWFLKLVRNFSYMYALDIARWVGELFVKAFFVGIYEEIVFRGWVLTFLLTRWGVGEKALATSALFFGLTHIHMGWWAALVTTMFGYIFGLLYVWRKNLVVPIILHILWNWAVWLGLLGRPS